MGLSAKVDTLRTKLTDLEDSIQINVKYFFFSIKFIDHHNAYNEYTYQQVGCLGLMFDSALQEQQEDHIIDLISTCFDTKSQLYQKLMKMDD